MQFYQTSRTTSQSIVLQIKKSYAVKLFLSLSMFTLCHGQNLISQADTNSSEKDDAIAKGDIVSGFSKSAFNFFQDSKNNLWIGSHGEGLYRYDGKTLVQFTTKHGLPNSQVRDLQEDKSGNIYFTTSGPMKGDVTRFCKFDGKTFSTLSVTKPDSSNSGWKLQPDDLWFSGPHRYDGKNLYQLELPKVKIAEDWLAKQRFKYPNMPNGHGVYTIYKDSKGNMWFGTGAAGVCRYDGESFGWITESDVNELHNGPANGVRSIIEDKDGYFWFSNSLYRYKIDQNSASGSEKDEYGNVPISYVREKSVGSLDGVEGGDADEYMSAVKDDKGDLWIAMYGAGVWRYDGKKVTHYPVMNGDEVITVYSIFRDRQGGLWVGTHEHGAYKFNGKTFEKFVP